MKVQNFMNRDFSKLPPPSTSAPIETKREALETVKGLEVDPIEKASEDIDTIFKNNNF